MRISTLFYVFKQGIRNIFRNKWFSLASVATMSICLFLFGLFFAIIVNFQNIVKAAQEGVSIVVFFDYGIEDSRIAEIGDLLDAREEVSDFVYVSPEEAWDGFKGDYLGDSGLELTENPLADSANYQVYMSDVSKQAELVEFLESVDGIRSVMRSELVASTLTGFNSLVAYVSMGIIILLLVVSVFLISNTVTVGISVRKEEIGIMKYVGATDFFVRSPFVIEGILIGFVGALIPLILVYYVYHAVIDYITIKFSVLSGLLAFMPVEELFKSLVPVCVIMGVGIGFLGSFITVRKHLRV
ncbi:MAG: permease-like cell division protein FtsX [Lachnospiraceae bacterium]|nr:permease-like cell division protein FtsX [Lachnospiraceae bacterium]MBR3683485.1 permease-like cell division protein FtsX [Lachnospiraceae bacterium]